MPRPKKSETNAASIVEEKNSTLDADTVDTVEDTKKNENIEQSSVNKKPINDDDKIIIKCAAYAGKSINISTRIIELDEKGCCEVTGVEAKYLLTIPGYERA